MKKVEPTKDAKKGMTRDTDIRNGVLTRQDWVIINKRWNRAIKLGILKVADVDKSRSEKKARKAKAKEK